MNHPRQGKNWTAEEDEALLKMHQAQAPLSEMVRVLGRSGEAVDRRLSIHGKSRTGRVRR